LGSSIIMLSLLDFGHIHTRSLPSIHQVQNTSAFSTKIRQKKLVVVVCSAKEE
jgi:hypothetical protein